MLPPPLVPVTLEQVTEGYTRFKDKTVYARRQTDDPNFAATIRTYEFVGTGLCSTKQKQIDVFFNKADNKFYGLSKVIPTRWFEVTLTPFFTRPMVKSAKLDKLKRHTMSQGMDGLAKPASVVVN